MQMLDAPGHGEGGWSRGAENRLAESGAEAAGRSTPARVGAFMKPCIALITLGVDDWEKTLASHESGLL